MKKTKAKDLIIMPEGIMTLGEALDRKLLTLRKGINGKTGNPSYDAWHKNGTGWEVGKTLFESRSGIKPTFCRVED